MSEVPLMPLARRACQNRRSFTLRSQTTARDHAILGTPIPLLLVLCITDKWPTPMSLLPVLYNTNKGRTLHSRADAPPAGLVLHSVLTKWIKGQDPPRVMKGEGA